VWTEGETPSLVEEIRTLALRYGLPSAYTSYLVQEQDVVADRPLPVGVGGVRQRTDVSASILPTAPAAASGANAVRRAEEARMMREAKSVGALAAAEDELAGRLGSDGTRTEGGRIFRQDGGVWIDVAHADDAAVFKVKAYSSAYFRILEALPELRPVLTRMDAVIVAGADVSLQVGDDGASDLSDAAVAGLVARFRGPRGAP
jgi:hypothetical protein